ncbi:MAG: glycosyltransferase family 39 protein [Chloroherpetonaceae bacterium]|nr:glycosyltransferase family 39 protein [Chthonomonadaceae bacterium]MDW8206632.1 glycosyltransferase family 39 protein [Chloroherpetonaceae bacterium]
MAVPSVDPYERQLAPPPVSPPSAFLWCGLLLLLLALATGTGELIRASRSQHSLSQQPLQEALLLFLSGVTLLFAQSRYLFWRQAAGIVEPHPLTPNTHRLADPAARILQRGDGATIAGLLVLAAVPRWLLQSERLQVVEADALRFYQNGALYALTQQSGYTNHPLDAFLGSLCVLWGQALNTDASAFPMLLRLPAFLLGCLSVPMLYLTARAAFGRSVGATAALLMAFLPSGIALSTQARGYSALIFFTIAQGFFLYRALHLTSAEAWTGWLVCSVLGAMAHLSFLPVFVSSVAFVLLRALWYRAYLNNPARSAALVEQAGIVCLAGLLLIGTVYLPTGAETFAFLSSRAGPPCVRCVAETAVSTLRFWIGLTHVPLTAPILLCCALLLLAAMWYLIQQASAGAIYLIAMIIVPFLFTPVMPSLLRQPEALSAGFPFFLIMLACGAMQCVQSVLGTGRRHL